MKHYLLRFAICCLIFSCKQKEEQPLFKESFKERKAHSKEQDLKEYLDTSKNIYSNYEYSVSFNGPDNWKSDQGVSEHTIYRTYNLDSAITFAINVIELNTSSASNAKNMWDYYIEDKAKLDNPYLDVIRTQLNTEPENYEVSKVYIKNNVGLRRYVEYKVRDQDYEYYNTVISQQVLIKNITYTFSLDLPTVFYKGRKPYFDNLFSSINFLLN